MQLESPLRTVTPTLDGPVLHAVARTTYPLTRRQITELVGDASEAGVRKVLRRLVDEGVVSEQRIGAQYSYSANRDHLAWPGIEMILSVRTRLTDRLTELVSEWEVQPLSVEIFGSVAGRVSTGASDVDILVYRPTMMRNSIADWDDQLVQLKDSVRRWTGNECEVLDLDVLALIEMVATDAAVLNSPRQHIFGIDLAAAMPDRALARLLWAHIEDPDPATNWSALINSLGTMSGTLLRMRTSPPFRVTFEQLTLALRSV